MDEFSTMDEIKSRSAPDRVVIAEPRIDDQLEVVGGKVILHGPDRDDLLYKAAALKLDRITVRYLGECPDPTLGGL